ncbi:hypothetical protein H0E84_08885 [Luteimonas sp. SJ-92]|uniref:Uncharacterized protein n=1 Tax=Luteimonas salinisoli TaxID=2752307 RepID=A0A853JD54_9GAMM|nr:hypothetical protein [Luteimonas salinisoli]NZA26500.1 hypothetical protein [Luteimonas salinisoli]
MREYPFDALLGGLVAALQAARGAAAGQYRRQVQAMAGEGGGTVGPAAAGVSVASLRAFRQIRIRDLAIEFDCMLQPCRKTSTVRLLLRQPARWRWPRRSVHRLRIELVDAPSPQCEVSIDGRGFKRFAIPAGP